MNHLRAAHALLTTGALLATAIAPGCSSSKAASPAPGSTTPAQVSGAPAGAVNPNAPEVHDAGDIPDNAVYVGYSPPDKSFTVRYPEGWSQTGSGDRVSFSDKFNAIDVETVAKVSPPTTESVTTIDLASVAANSGNFKAGRVTTVSRKGGSAIMATYQIDSTPNAVTGKTIRVAVERYEFWRNGRSVVLTLLGAVGADNADPWRTVTDSFTWSA